ncbi:serine/threonine-protein kinase [Populibacterium corticicola]|uniref:non-specific serine/threonine protein kinase n=1 Tax=Populibacterium corticicola TaxID=1812826 RepID=A0ABW5XEL4_9MICO
MKPQAGLALGGRYRLIRQIAVGGMGEVWVAKDESLARDIAVKVLKEEFVGNADFLNRFRVEARNAASLSHAHIAQLYDYGEQDGSAYLVMELVHGEPMSDLLEREPVLPLGRLLTILSQTSRALHAAHVGGVVHRDIKPGNIIIEHSGDVKITDFGVSLAANQVPMTAAGMVMGTAQYLSPEQAIGRPATGASDIYALGIVAYEAIAGNRPFTGKTPVDIAVAHVNEPVPPLPRTTHAELANLVMRMLSKDPLERPRSGAALAHTFEGLAQEIAANPWKSTARTSAASPVSHGLAPSRDKAVEDLGPQLRSAQSASSAAPHTTWQPSGGAVGSRAAASNPPATVRPRSYRAEQGPTNTPSPRQESHAAAVPTYRADTTRRATDSGGGSRRATTHTAPGGAGGRPDRRQEAHRTTAEPQGFLERVKALGVVGMTMLGVIALIILATAIKGMIGAVGSHTPSGTVAENFSSVEFTSGAPNGIEVRENRGSDAYPASPAQAIKDA